jgi:tetratricopeptide (TPR) repeat protein
LALLDLADHRDDPFVWLTVGSSYLRTEGGAVQALYYLDRCVTAFPRGSTIQLNAYRYLAQAHAALGNSEQERATYERALQISPHDLGLRLQLGAWHENRGAWTLAIQQYETALTHGKQRASAVHLRNSRVELALRLGKLYLAVGRPEAAQRLWASFSNAYPAATAVRQALQTLQFQSSTIIA